MFEYKTPFKGKRLSGFPDILDYMLINYKVTKKY